MRGLDRIRRRARGSDVLVVMYHRVATPDSDPYLLSVTPERFAEHLEVLRSKWNVLGLCEAMRLVRRGRLPRRAAVITFDDGYADNLLAAKPLLERYDLPATVYVSSGYLDGEREFWWDELEAIFLQPGTLPETLRLAVDGDVHEWSLDGAREYPRGAYERLRLWNVLDPSDPTPRHAACRSLHGVLRGQTPQRREELLDEVRAWAGGACEPRSTHRQLSPDELRQLAGGGLVEIGGHTVTHPLLSMCPAEEQEREIRVGKQRLEEILGRPVRSFAYPFGGPTDYGPATVEIVRAAGFECACSNFEGLATAVTDPFQVPRTMVMDWPAAEFEARLERFVER